MGNLIDKGRSTLIVNSIILWVGELGISKVEKVS